MCILPYRLQIFPLEIIDSKCVFRTEILYCFDFNDRFITHVFTIYL